MKLSLFSIRIISLIFFVSVLPDSVMAQGKNNLDSLDVDQLNLGMRKDIAMRKAGIILTLTGLGIFTAGGITSIIMAANPPDDPNEDPWYKLRDLVPVALGCLAGLSCIVVGLPLKAIGERRINAKAVLLLRKLEMLPGNSMAIGLVMTVRF